MRPAMQQQKVSAVGLVSLQSGLFPWKILRQRWMLVGSAQFLLTQRMHVPVYLGLPETTCGPPEKSFSYPFCLAWLYFINDGLFKATLLLRGFYFKLVTALVNYLYFAQYPSTLMTKSNLHFGSGY